MELLVGIKFNPQANEKLKNAVIEGSLEKVQEALKEGADIDFKFQTTLETGYIGFYSAIFHAVRLGHVNIAKFLLKPGDVVSNTKLLHDHLFRQPSFRQPFDLDFIEYLIKFGASIDRELHGNFPITHAIMRRDLSLIKLFCFYGANDNVDVGKYKTAVEFADYWWFNASTNNEDRIKSLSIKNFLENHFLRMKNIKNKNIKDIVHKVNTIIRKNLSDSEILLGELRNLVESYLQYPEDAENFFNLPDSIDEILKLYSEEFEKNEKTEKEKLEYEDPCVIM